MTNFYIPSQQIPLRTARFILNQRVSEDRLDFDLIKVDDVELRLAPLMIFGCTQVMVDSMLAFVDANHHIRLIDANSISSGYSGIDGYRLGQPISIRSLYFKSIAKLCSEWAIRSVNLNNILDEGRLQARRVFSVDGVVFETDNESLIFRTRELDRPYVVTNLNVIADLSRGAYKIYRDITDQQGQTKIIDCGFIDDYDGCESLKELATMHGVDIKIYQNAKEFCRNRRLQDYVNEPTIAELSDKLFEATNIINSIKSIDGIEDKLDHVNDLFVSLYKIKSDMSKVHFNETSDREQITALELIDQIIMNSTIEDLSHGVARVIESCNVLVDKFAHNGRNMKMIEQEKLVAGGI